MQRHTTPHLPVATVMAFVVALAACGGGSASDDAPARGTESFCSALGALEDVESDLDNAEPFVDGLVRIEDAAPDEIVDDASTVRQFIERSAEIGRLGADEQAQAIEEFGALQGDFDVAVKNVEDYARSNCPDLDESFFGS